MSILMRFLSMDDWAYTKGIEQKKNSQQKEALVGESWNLNENRSIMPMNIFWIIENLSIRIDFMVA